LKKRNGYNDLKRRLVDVVKNMHSDLKEDEKFGVSNIRFWECDDREALNESYKKILEAVKANSNEDIEMT
jgi:hypothetical protein